MGRQKLRPGSGFLSIRVTTDGPTRVLQVLDIKERVCANFTSLLHTLRLYRFIETHFHVLEENVRLTRGTRLVAHRRESSTDSDRRRRPGIGFQRVGSEGGSAGRPWTVHRVAETGGRVVVRAASRDLSRSGADAVQHHVGSECRRRADRQSAVRSAVHVCFIRVAIVSYGGRVPTRASRGCREAAVEKSERRDIQARHSEREASVRALGREIYPKAGGFSRNRQVGDGSAGRRE